MLQGCATVAHPDKRDPLESINRSVFAFNDAADAAVVMENRAPKRPKRQTQKQRQSPK